MKTDIGIICALKKESTIIIKSLKNKKVRTICGIRYYRGFIGDKKVVVCVSGMGKVSAAISAQTMILKFNPKVIINTGVGGSLTKELKVCDVVISSLFVQHDVDSSPLGDPKGFISGIDLTYIPGSDSLRDDIKRITDKLNIKSLTGIIATGDIFVDGKENKQRINEEFNAIACDMESGSIAQVCYNAKVDFCAIRSISDNMDGESNVDFANFLQKAVEVGSKITIEYISQENV